MRVLHTLNTTPQNLTSGQLAVSERAPLQGIRLADSLPLMSLACTREFFSGPPAIAHRCVRLSVCVHACGFSVTMFQLRTCLHPMGSGHDLSGTLGAWFHELDGAPATTKDAPDEFDVQADTVSDVLAPSAGSGDF